MRILNIPACLRDVSEWDKRVMLVIIRRSRRNFSLQFFLMNRAILYPRYHRLKSTRTRQQRCRIREKKLHDIHSASTHEGGKSTQVFYRSKVTYATLLQYHFLIGIVMRYDSYVYNMILYVWHWTCCANRKVNFLLIANRGILIDLNRINIK